MTLAPLMSGGGKGTAKPGMLQGDELAAFHAALALSPAPSLLADADGRIVVTNPPLDALMRFPAQELAGRNIEVLIPQEIHHRHRALMRDFHKTPAQRQMGKGRDLYAAASDGSRVPVEIGLTPLQIGEADFVYVTLFDLTERKRSEARLNAILDGAASALMLLDGENRIEMVNHTACKMLGQDANTLLGSDLTRFIPPERRATFLNIRAGTATAADHLIEITAPDGPRLPVRVVLTPIRGPEGICTMATLIDMSDHLAQEVALKRRNDTLEALNDELSQFAYSASHDLRAPLATIAGLLEICLEDFDEGELTECRHNIGEALQTSRRNIHKVEAVLTLARAGLTPVEPEAVDLVALIRACWEALPDKGVAKPVLTIALDGSAGIRTERSTLLTAIEALLSNAARFQDDTKTMNWVLVRIRTRDEAVSISVCDNGTGIAEAELVRVFELFRRSAASAGHGLGLAMVQKHVRRLGGAVALTSGPEGTSFILTFPGMEIIR